MEALTLAPADLNVLENNMLTLNDSLRSVSNDVLSINGKMSSFNSKVSTIESNVNTLEEQIKNFMKEIKGLSLVSNAQNNILIENTELSKKCGTNSDARSIFKKIIDLIKNNKLNELDFYLNKCNDLNDEYYLSHLIRAVIYWALDNKSLASEELNKSLRLNCVKTSLILCMFYDDLNRKDISYRWLKYYFNSQNFDTLDNSFIYILEILSEKYLGNASNELIVKNLEQIKKRANLNVEDLSSAKEKWNLFFSSVPYNVNENEFPYLKEYSKESFDMITSNLKNARLYYEGFMKFKTLIEKEEIKNNKLNIFNRLVNSLEGDELRLNNNIIRNKLIIDNDGDYDKVDSIIEKDIELTNANTFYSVLNNIVVSKNNVSNNTVNLCLALNKDVIKESLDSTYAVSKDLGLIKITIKDWEGTTKDGSNETELIESLDKNIYNSLVDTYKGYSVSYYSIIIGVLLLVAGLISFKFSTVLALLLLVGSFIAGVYFAYNYIKKNEEIKKNYDDAIKYYNSILENVLAEIVDVNFELKFQKSNKEYFDNYLDKLNINDYMNDRVV